MRSALALVIVAACGGKQRTPTSTYAAVHIDVLAKDKVEQFVGARKAWVAAMDASGANDGRGVFLFVGDHVMINVRRFSTWASFDTRGDAIDASLARVPKAASEAYDKGSDDSLVWPHASEVWELDKDLSIGTLDEASADAGTIVWDDVKPDPADEDRYWKAVGEENAALAKAGYPLTRLGFRTRFGAGHVITLWLAASEAARDGAPSVEAAVASVVGEARAKALEADIAASIVHRDAQPFAVRHDLTRLRTIGE
ncbi:MAG TPA: hypothetical protein VL463_34780 [Kofleriaceae bacterium]|nr:hypothetical protein [Kofleriaceae bacterium]